MRRFVESMKTKCENANYQNKKQTDSVKPKMGALVSVGLWAVTKITRPNWPR